jgi:hypothetical protein
MRRCLDGEGGLRPSFGAILEELERNRFDEDLDRGGGAILETDDLPLMRSF